MRKLPEDERLKRGIQVLLNDQDQEDLRTMAAEKDMALSSMLRIYAQEALDEWRASKKGKKKR